MTHTWDPDRYLIYADERGRPFLELLGRVRATTPATVVDLGCGPGNLTAVLAERWGPTASVCGVDSSPEMIARARSDHPDIDFAVADLREYLCEVAPVDVLVSNATLQWVPGHLELMPGLVRAVAPGGWLAFQVPRNFEQPSHTIRRDLAAEEPYRRFTANIAAPDAFGAGRYLEALAGLGCDVDAWETTYLHVLTGDDPVYTWVSGTGARPTLEALPDDVRPAFEAEFKRRLRDAYPPGPTGVVLPFRRVFVVARTPS